MVVLDLLAGEGSVGREGCAGVGRWSMGGEGELLGTLGPEGLVLLVGNWDAAVGDVGERVDADEA